MKTIDIDGSFGEGGGQVLRTALSLSCVTGTPFKLVNIRKGRKRPGLMPQHLTAVHAAALISSAQVSGDEKGSTELAFVPGKIRAGSYLFDITTAGSSALVFQTLLPLLVCADTVSTITIKGGTHVPFSPSYHHIAEVFIPVVKSMGLRIESAITAYGFYPKGGGQVRFTVKPADAISGLNKLSRGELRSVRGYSGVANLPMDIAERQKQSVIRHLYHLSADIETLDVSSPAPGTFVFLKSVYENAVAGFSSLGERGIPAEHVGKKAAQDLLHFHNTESCLDPHLADQVVIYLGLAGEASSFTTSQITQHLTTNLWMVRKFLNIQYEIEGEIGSEGTVRIMPASKV